MTAPDDTGRVGPDAPPRLSVRGMRKTFGPTLAVDDVDFTVRPGSVHSLLGENGAGKSTLMNLVYGVHRPDAGTIEVDGAPVAIGRPADALAAGIAMVHQHSKLVPSFTVAESLQLSAGKAAPRVLDARASAARVRGLADRLGLDVDPAAVISELSLGARQRVEILCAIGRDARLLVLDEPTAVLAPGEVEPLFDLLRRIAADGHSIVIITHRLAEVFAVSDTISVMRRGRLVATLSAVGTDRDEVLGLLVPAGPEAVLEASEVVADQREADAGPVRLEIRDLVVASEPGSTGLRGCSLVARAGSVLAIAGVEGNGQKPLVEVLAGVRKPVGGAVLIDGAEFAPDASDDVIAVVPEDRHTEGLVLDLSTAENLALGRAGRVSRFGFLRRGAMRARAQEEIERFGIVTAGPDSPVRRMSGGNQQKVVLARALAGDPRVLVTAQATRGLDPGAAAAVLDRIRRARDAGAAVVFISSDLEEVLEIGDEVAVMFGGAIAGRFARDDVDLDVVATLMTGAGAGAGAGAPTPDAIAESAVSGAAAAPGENAEDGR